jgi:hypothetical protein
MKALERRLAALERGSSPESGWNFGALTEVELERLEAILIASEDGPLSAEDCAIYDKLWHAS